MRCQFWKHALDCRSTIYETCRCSWLPWICYSVADMLRLQLSSLSLRKDELFTLAILKWTHGMLLYDMVTTVTVYLQLCSFWDNGKFTTNIKFIFVSVQRVFRLETITFRMREKDCGSGEGWGITPLLRLHPHAVFKHPSTPWPKHCWIFNRQQLESSP